MRIQTNLIEEESKTDFFKIFVSLWYPTSKSSYFHRRASTNRLAMATFWRTFYQDGKWTKFSPAWRVWGVHGAPFHSIYHH
jgi:hypothetical protein